jgi:hypothetical protein
MTKTTCAIEHCGGDILARGWCRKHYYRWKRMGDPLKTDRYMDHREALKNYPHWEGECLIWYGQRDSSGYGLINVDGKRSLVHRYVWSQANGPLDSGTELDHSCHNRACINMDHLRIATRSENTANKAGPRADNLSSGVRNVYRAKNGWTVQMTKDGQQYYFGLYPTIEEASVVAKTKRQELFGIYAGKG